MRDQEWDSTTAQLNALDLAQLVLGLLGLDAVDGEAALGVVDETEVLASLLNGDDVHVAGGVGDVGADLAVDLDEALHHDGLGLAVVESILETVSDEDDQGHAVAELVRTGRGLGGVQAGQLVQEPVGGGAKALLVLLAVRGEDVSLIDSIVMLLLLFFQCLFALFAIEAISILKKKKIVLLAKVNLRSPTHSFFLPPLLHEIEEDDDDR